MKASKRKASPFSAVFGGIDGRVSLDPTARWLERNVGPIDMLLRFIAEDLRGKPSKAQREELASVLEYLSIEITRLRPSRGRRGAPDKFLTWRDAALVNALTTYAKVDQARAVEAVAGDDRKRRERIERYLRKKRAAGLYRDLSRNERDYQAALQRIPRVHRIK